MSNSNVKTIQGVYEAFGRGDVPYILDRVEDSTEWSFNVSQSDVPWHAKVNGKAALPEFFGNLVGNVDIRAFEPLEFMDSGDNVMAHIHIEYEIKKTNRYVSMNQLHWWKFNSQGEISGLVHFEDTAQVISAYSG